MTTNLKKDCDIIEENFKLYKSILFPPKILENPVIFKNDNQIKELTFEISSNLCPSYPNSNMDESCNLRKHFRISQAKNKQSKNVNFDI